MSITNMNTLKDLRKFVIKEMINKSSVWSTEGRKDFYSTSYLSIKKIFDSVLWQFILNNTDRYFDFKSIGINRYFLYLLFLFVKNNIKKQLNIRKNESLVNVWNSFLDNNKDLKRNSKIDKIIKD